MPKFARRSSIRAAETEASKIATRRSVLTRWRCQSRRTHLPGVSARKRQCGTQYVFPVQMTEKFPLLSALIASSGSRLATVRGRPWK